MCTVQCITGGVPQLQLAARCMVYGGPSAQNRAGQLLFQASTHQAGLGHSCSVLLSAPLPGWPRVLDTLWQPRAPHTQPSWEVNSLKQSEHQPLQFVTSKGRRA